MFFTLRKTRHDLLKVDRLPKELDDKNLKKVLHVLNVLNFSEEERELYEDHLKWLRIEPNTLKKLQRKLERKVSQKVLRKRLLIC